MYYYKKWSPKFYHFFGGFPYETLCESCENSLFISSVHSSSVCVRILACASPKCHLSCKYNCVAVKIFNISYLLTAKMTFGQNPGPKMFSKSLIMLFSPWVNLGDWKMDLYRWDASIFPHLSVEEDDKGVDLLDLLLQEVHQLLHSLTIALNIISKAWLDLDRKELIDLIINLDLDFGLSNAWSVNNCYRSLVVAIPPELLLVTKLHLIFTASFAHLSLPWSIDWVALSFLVRCSFRHGDIFSSSSFFFFSSSFSYFGGLRHPCHPHHHPSPSSPLSSC